MFSNSHLQKVLIPLAFPLILSACASQQAPPAFPPMPVEVQKLTTSTVSDSTEYVATLISRHSVNLQSQVPGQVTAIYVKPGDYVKKGAPLIQVDPSRQQAAVNSASAAAQAQQAQIGQARESLQILQEQREALLSSVDVTQSQYNRYAGLAAQRSASQQDVERFQNELNQAQASLEANAAQIEAQRAAIVTAQKQYEQARAATREQQVQLQYHKVNAPFSGVVGHIPVKLGNYVQPLTQLLSVTDNDPLEVNISVPAERAMELRTGLPVEIMGGNGQLINRTKLSFVSPQVDQEAQTILTKAVLSNPGGRLKADQIVSARLIWQESPGLRVPTQAVLRMGGRDFVYVMESAGPKQFVAKQRPVTLGRIEGGYYIVQSGLKAGESLITAGIQKLGDGAPVSPQP